MGAGRSGLDRAHRDLPLDRLEARHPNHVRPVRFLLAPQPALGPQKPPVPGIHNSGWVQSPGTAALVDQSQHPRLEAYVRGVVGAFADDPRVLAWDLWNEPDNHGLVNAWSTATLMQKADLVAPVLTMAFDWARATAPTQPLTCAIWIGDWSKDEPLSPFQRIQVDHSDVISFHTYGNGHEFAERFEWLRRYDRPLLCTEYLARAHGSTFEAVLPFAKANGIAVFNWGLVCGKTQTHLPWDSWTTQDGSKADVWFHDIFHEDGTPYRDEEVGFIRAMTLGARQLDVTPESAGTQPFALSTAEFHDRPGSLTRKSASAS